MIIIIIINIKNYNNKLNYNLKSFIMKAGGSKPKKSFADYRKIISILKTKLIGMKKQEDELIKEIKEN